MKTGSLAPNARRARIPLAVVWGTVCGLACPCGAARAQDEAPATHAAEPPRQNAGEPVAPALELKAHEGAVHAVAFSTAGDSLATLGADGMLRLWRLPKGKATGEVACWASALNRPVFTADGGAIVYLANQRRLAVHTLTRQGADRAVDWPEPGKEITAFDASADGRFMAAASGDRLGVWETARGEAVGVRSPEEGVKILAVAFAPDGTRVALWFESGRLAVCEVRTGKIMTDTRLDLPGGRIAWSPLGNPILARRADRRLYSLELKAGAALHLADLPEERSPFDFSPLGTSMVAGWNDGTIRVRNRTGGQWAGAPFTGGAAPVTALRYSWNGVWLCAGDAAGTVRLWPVTPEPGS